MEAKFAKLLEVYRKSPKGWKLWLKYKPEIKALLNEKFPFLTDKESLYWLDHKLQGYEPCPVCGKPCKTFLGRNKGYAKHCSSKCSSLDKQVQKKTEKTNLSKYGKKNPAQSETVKSKMKKTTLERYGSENYFSSKEGKKKIKEVLFNRYKVENPQQCDIIKEKTKKTLLDKYGVSCGFLTAKKITRSKGEIEVFEFVKTLIPDATNSDREAIQPFELDIYIPSLKIGIEYDGDYWHSLPNMVKRDRFKDMLCKNKHIKLIRIKESEWKNNKENIQKFLEETIHGC